MIHPNKTRTIQTAFGVFSREAVRTHFIQVGEDLLQLMERYVLPVCPPGSMVAVSSKIVSLCQKRVVFKKDMKLSPLARFLSPFASTSTAGVGVHCVWKMQYAIDRCGRGRVLWAAVCGGIAKLFGKRGVFYDILGPEVRGLDGFYGSSFPEYGEFGIEIPTDCSSLCDRLYEKTGIPVFITDANDFTRDIFGKASVIPFSDDALCQLICDNPAGQSNQCTPFVIIQREAP